MDQKKKKKLIEMEATGKCLVLSPTILIFLIISFSTKSLSCNISFLTYYPSFLLSFFGLILLSLFNILFL